MKRLFAIVLLLGCGKSEEQGAADAAIDAFDAGPVTCPTDQPMAGTACAGSGSCTYRCGCGYTMTATCAGERWSTTYCPSPTELCRDGGTCPVDPPNVGDPCEGAQHCTYPCGACAANYEATCVSGKWRGVPCSAAPIDKMLCAGTCKTDDDCVPLRCANLPGGPVNPTPTCYDKCIADPTKVQFCDGNLGLCIPDFGGTCIDMCIMDADGTRLQSCFGNTGCEVRHIVDDATTGKPQLIGACLGGCTKDSDCPDWAFCQTEFARCSGTKTFYVKKLGEACTSTDDCACLIDPSTKTGVCADVCLFGSACKAGYTCDPRLPKGEFTAIGEPRLLGNCLKDCSSDADCTSPAKCIEHAVIGHKTCSIER